MSSIGSTVKEISDLFIEVPERGSVYKLTKYAALSDGGFKFVAVTNTGKVISNSLAAKGHYGLGSKLWPLLEALAKLGVISRKAVRQHKEQERVFLELEAASNQLTRVRLVMEKAGLKLSDRDVKKLQAKVESLSKKLENYE